MSTWTGWSSGRLPRPPSTRCTACNDRSPGAVGETRPAVRQSPRGTVTRGTTNPNRLRRVDNWLVATYGRLLREAADPLVVDLGYGATPVTTVELHARLARVRPDVRVVGLEIDPVRVAQAEPVADPPGL